MSIYKANLYTGPFGSEIKPFQHLSNRVYNVSSMEAAAKAAVAAWYANVPFMRITPAEIHEGPDFSIDEWDEKESEVLNTHDFILLDPFEPEDHMYPKNQPVKRRKPNGWGEEDEHR